MQTNGLATRNTTAAAVCVLLWEILFNDNICASEEKPATTIWQTDDMIFGLFKSFPVFSENQIAGGGDGKVSG